MQNPAELIRLEKLGINFSIDNAKEIIEWAVSHEPICSPHILKVASILYTMRKYGYQNMVETGTYLGLTTRIVAECGHNVITIELSEELYKSACAMFAGNPRVTCLQGDSGTKIADAVALLTEPALFWLDGHHCTDASAKGDSDTPILQELEYLTNAPARYQDLISRSSFFIDDIRLFGDGDYPSVDTIAEIVRQRLPGHAWVIANDAMRICPRR